jgi:deaminated glutathione amidase
MRIALVQLNSGLDIDANLETCRRFAEDAASAGVRWLLYPENAPFLGTDADKLPIAESLDGSMVAAFARIARDHDCFVTLGSFPERSPDPKRTYNTQVLFAPTGDILAVYRKIHLFDVEIEGGVSFCESGSVVPGADVVTAPLAYEDHPRTVGLTICYDLRFPELYRRLSQSGAEILTVPSAFTLATGRDHWHPLLQARAIENQCYVLAPNQWGHHGGNRYSYGHSVVYDPWGRRIACASDRPGVVLAELDFDYLDGVRKRMPVLTHRRM